MGRVTRGGVPIWPSPPLGQGRCIVSQLRLLANPGKDPVADKILFNLIDFASASAKGLESMKVK